MGNSSKIPNGRRSVPMKTIKYCCRNEKLGSKAVYKELRREYPDVKQKRKDCLGNCKQCHKQCIARLGKGSFICAASPDQLYAELKLLIEAARREEAGVPV
jgi:uncharacterized protein YuzB (UPF0349 family)